MIRASCVAVVLAALVGGGTALAASQSVTISDLAFSPASVTVLVGDTVTWTNSDPQVHTATSDDGSWDAGNIAANGGTGAFVFTTAGTFPYHCTIHTQMTGTVTVQAAAATTAPTARASMAPTDAAAIFETGSGAGGGLLSSLFIAAVAAFVGALVIRRRPAPAVAPLVAVQSPAVTGRAVTPPIDRAPAGSPGGAPERSFGPIVVVAIASAVAVAVVLRKRSSGR